MSGQKRLVDFCRNRKRELALLVSGVGGSRPRGSEWRFSAGVDLARYCVWLSDDSVNGLPGGRLDVSAALSIFV
jgi:hypothetical protein